MKEIKISIHPPKHLSSSTGLGLPNCTRNSKRVSSTIIVTTETWNEIEKPWVQSKTIIAKPGYKWIAKWEEGTNFTINKIYDDKRKLVALYCDIGSPLKKIPNGLEFDDWYLDVWQLVGSKPELLDEDELNEAVKLGFLTEKEAVVAKDTANQLIKELAKSIPDF